MCNGLTTLYKLFLPPSILLLRGGLRELAWRFRRTVPRFGVPELDHLELPVEETAVSWEHRNNTLIVSYRKPSAVVSAEEKDRQEILKMGDEVRLF